MPRSRCRLRIARGILSTTFILLASPGGAPPVLRTTALVLAQGGSGIAGLIDALDMIRDLLRRRRYTEAENVGRALLARLETAAGRDSLEVAQALDLLSEALRLKQGPNDDERREFAERAVAIREQKLGVEHPTLAISLTNLAIHRTLAGDAASAQLLLERALAIREKAFGPEDLSVAATLQSLAGILMINEDDRGARPLLERALKIREKVFGSDHPEVGRLLFSIAGFYGETNDYAEARRLYERALAIHEKTAGPDHPLTLSTLQNLAVASSHAGDYRSAALLNERLLATAEKRFGPTDPRLTIPLNNLAFDLIDLGDYDGAKRLAERALAIHERTVGPNHPAVADSLHTLASAHAELGNYGEALRLFERSIRIREDAFPRVDSEVGRALVAIPSLVRVSGDAGEDNGLYERALAMREKSRGLGDPLAATSLNALAATLLSAGDYARAKPLFERALSIQQSVLGGDHPQVAAAAKNLADVLLHEADPAAAKVLYERALSIWEKSLGSEHPRLATALVSLARAHLVSGGTSEAAAQLRRAVSIQQKTLPPDHPDFAETLSALAEVEARLGDSAKGFELAAEAETISREHLRLTARVLPERQALAYASARTPALDLMIGLASEPSASATMQTLAWDAVTRARGLVLDEMVLRRRAIESAPSPDVAGLADALTAARQRLASLVVRGVGAADPNAHRRVLERARRDKDSAERALADRSATFREERSRDLAGFDAVAAALPGDSALVAFVKYQHHGEAAYLAFILPARGGSPSVLRLGSAERTDNLVLRWRRELEQEAMAPGRASRRMEANYRRVAVELRQQIWDPLVPHLRLAKQVFIVPDGALHLVSFAALPVGASQYLIETGPLLHYLSLERDLVQPATEEAKRGGLLVVANPAFGRSDGPASTTSLKPVRGLQTMCSDLGSMRFDPLPATSSEAARVVNQWTHANGGEGILSLVGAAASESAFKASAPGHRVIHLATHGFFLGDQCVPALDSSVAASQRRESRRITTDNPLLLSGLALADANLRNAARPNEEDGVVTAEEIAALNFSGVQWVVLSGCDTGVGQIRSSEGVFGLTRAFRIAGAATIIMSLWPVEDGATEQWMGILYDQRLQKGVGTAEAVHAASLGMLRTQRSSNRSSHPFYWAGFVATGDWH